MPRVTSVQAAHSYGVLDPLVIERRDTKFLAASLSDGLNVVLLPQGGYTDAGGSADRGRARRILAAVATTADLFSLPNGGDAADMLAGETVTTGAAAGVRFVLAEVTFAAPQTLIMIDVAGIAIADTPAAGALVAEWHDGATWQPFGTPKSLTLKAISRRIASGPPDHGGHTATRFRLAVDATTAAGAVSFSRIVFTRETVTLADGILLGGYAPEEGTPHELVITPGNVDVYEAGTWRAAVNLPLTDAMLRKATFEARFDTVIAWHTDLRPRAMTRLGTSTEWACDPVAFTNMPRVDYGGVYANGITEVQHIAYFGASAGDEFELLLEGITTAAIQLDLGGDAAVSAANIKAALEALPNVQPGLTVTAVDSANFTVEFTGAGNAGRDWLQMGATALNSGGFVRVRTSVQGKAAGEDIMSDARGWPAVGRFVQQRLIMGGLKSRPKSVLASALGDPYDLNVELDLPTRAFSYDVEMPESTAIRDILNGPSLMIFGDRQVAFLKNETLSAEEVPKWRISDAPGIRQGITPIATDNAVFYFDRDGPLRQLTYSAVEENLIGDNASVLSAFLIRDPRGLTRRRPLGKVDTDLLLSINADGTATALTLMRSQEVSGFAPWRTDGKFRAFCTDLGNTVWSLVERQVGGVPMLKFEEMQPAALLSEAIELAAPVGTVLAGLGRLEGRQVWGIAENRIFGPFIVTAGAITLPRIVTGTVRVGTWIAPIATDPAFFLEEETRQRQPRLKRVNRVVASVLETTSLAIAANGADPIDIPLRSNEDTLLDEGPLARPVSDRIEAEGFPGFTRTASVTVTQLYPGHLTVRSLTKDVVA